MSANIQAVWAGTEDAAKLSGICKRNLFLLLKRGAIKSRYIIVQEGATRGKRLWFMPSIFTWIEAQTEESSMAGGACEPTGETA